MISFDDDFFGNRGPSFIYETVDSCQSTFIFTSGSLAFKYTSIIKVVYLSELTMKCVFDKEARQYQQMCIINEFV